MKIIMPLMLMTLIELILLVLLLVIKRKKPKIAKSKVQKSKKIKEKFSLKKVKPEQWIVFAIYLIVLGFIGYIALSNFVPDLMKPVNSGGYIIDGGVDVLKSFYFEKDVFGDKIEIDGEEYLPFVSEEINNIIFTPKKIIPESSGVFEVEGINNGTDLYINDKLVVPNLDNYVKVKDYSNSEVYVRKDYSYDSLEDYDKLEDYLYYNFPQAEVYSFKSLDDSVPVLMDYKQENTKIEGPFRDNLNLVVYHGGGILKIRGDKQDLNNYVGKDEYNFIVKDFSGKEIYSKILEDDGDSQDSKKLGEEESFSESINLERGIYYIEFVKDKKNPSADSTLKDLVFNSNKVLIKGKFLPWSEDQKFFTEVIEKKKIGFNYWWTNKYQTIFFSGSNSFKVKLDEEDKSEWVYKELEKGNYNFRAEKGYLWIDNDYTSVSKENWFNLPSKSKEKMFSSDVLVIDKNILKIEGEKFLLNLDMKIKSDDKINFQVLDSGKLLIKRIELKI